MKALIFCIIITLSSFSCTPYKSTRLTVALEIAGENAEELQKVLDHYRWNSEKKAAAIYLIENMIDKGERICMPNENETEVINLDLQHLSSSKLITHLDHVFQIKKESPFCQSLPDSIFNEYILPHRLADERFDNYLNNVKIELGHLKSSVYNCATIEKAINLINDTLKVHFEHGGTSYYKDATARNFSELMNDGKGQCRDMSNLMVYALRYFGIPCGIDYVSLKKGDDSVGHSWCFYYNAKEKTTIPFYPISNVDMASYQMNFENSPKIWRTRYVIKQSDWNVVKRWEVANDYSYVFKNDSAVTPLYYKTVDYTQVSKYNYGKNMYYLCCIYKGRWTPVDYLYADGTTKELTFKDVGIGNIYCVATNNQEFHMVSLPKMLDDKGKLHLVINRSKNPSQTSVKFRVPDQKQKIMSFSMSGSASSDYPGLLLSYTNERYEVYSMNRAGRWQLLNIYHPISEDKQTLVYLTDLPINNLLLVKGNRSGVSRPFMVDNSEVTWY